MFGATDEKCRKVKYKADWQEALSRLTALWHHELIDRPCIAVRAPSGKGYRDIPQPLNDEARWLDPVFRSACAERELETTWWGGESIPSVLAIAAFHAHGNGGVSCCADRTP